MTATEDLLRTPNDPQRLDRAAALLVCLVISLAVLYPQSFISHGSVLGKSWMDPLAAMMPLVAAAGLAYLALRRQDIKVNRVDWLVGAFGLYMAAQNISGPQALVTVKYVVLGLGTYYLVTLLASRGEPFYRWILYAIVGLLLVTALYGLLEFVLQRNVIFVKFISESVPDPGNEIHRSGSTLAHPVPFGTYLLQVLPYAALLLAISSSWRQRGVAMAAMLTGVLALFFTFSKGSWIVATFFAGTALLTILRTRSKRALMTAAVIIGVMLAVTGLFWQTIANEFTERSSSSISGREVAWRAAIAGIRQHPFGVGFLQGSTEMVSNIDPEWYAAWGQPLAVDNYYLALTLESGVLGLVIWVGMMVMIFREGIGVARTRGPTQPWALAALVGMIAICLNSLTVDAFLLWPNYLVFWVSAGLLHGLAWRQAGCNSQPAQSVRNSGKDHA